MNYSFFSLLMTILAVIIAIKSRHVIGEYIYYGYAGDCQSHVMILTTITSCRRGSRFGGKNRFKEKDEFCCVSVSGVCDGKLALLS